jgi:hypothetical protein
MMMTMVVRSGVSVVSWHAVAVLDVFLKNGIHCLGNDTMRCDVIHWRCLMLGSFAVARLSLSVVLKVSPLIHGFDRETTHGFVLCIDYQRQFVICFLGLFVCLVVAGSIDRLSHKPLRLSGGKSTSLILQKIYLQPSDYAPSFWINELYKAEYSENILPTL